MTHIALLRLVAHEEDGHGGDGLHLQQEHALRVAHLTKVVQERKVLRQVLTVRLVPVPDLKIITKHNVIQHQVD